MKIPVSPPPQSELIEQTPDDMKKVLLYRTSPAPDGKYLHWEKLRHLPPPEGLSNKQWWLAIKLSRLNSSREIPLADSAGLLFSYCLPDPLLEEVHSIDSRAKGRVATTEDVINEESRDRFLISSLIEEAITSSQLEGAATTRQVAAQMLRESRKPRDKSEQMILNNFQAMQEIVKLKHEPMSIDLLLHLHSSLTQDTLDDSSAAGRFQMPNEERVRVVDHGTGTTLHAPPPAEQIPERMEQLVTFANATNKAGGFLHPIVKSIILHFWLAYVHPFFDGNGRVARALFYWSAARSGYWLLEYISISRVLKAAPARYARSFLYTETDENDLTYFLLDQAIVINRAIDSLERHLKLKSEQVKRVAEVIRDNRALNHRQVALLSHAIRHPGHRYTIRSHQTSHRVAYATARKDLLELAELELLNERPVDKKTFGFVVPHDIEERVNRLAD